MMSILVECALYPGIFFFYDGRDGLVFDFINTDTYVVRDEKKKIIAHNAVLASRFIRD